MFGSTLKSIYRCTFNKNKVQYICITYNIYRYINTVYCSRIIFLNHLVKQFTCWKKTSFSFTKINVAIYVLFLRQHTMFEYMRDEMGGWNLKPEKIVSLSCYVFFVIELQIFVLLYMYICLVIHVCVCKGNKGVTNKKNQDQATQI